MHISRQKSITSRSIKKTGALIVILTQENIGFKLSEIMVGSGIRKKPIPDPGAKKVADPGSGSATLSVVSAFCGKKLNFLMKVVTVVFFK
jgi:hypothetical protein